MVTSVSSGLNSVVSPIPFQPSGVMCCVLCSGAGHTWAEPRIEVEFIFPTFQANPPGRTWHVERAGKVLLSGTGLNRCYDSNHRDRAESAAASLAERIDALTRSPEEAPSCSTLLAGGLPELRPNLERGGLELRFPSKPAEVIRRQLYDQGWRWSRFARCWYTRKTAAAEAFAHDLISRLSA
ncbi:MAG TPA: hypothetical protein VIA62_03645 [Thermoanaerobaculia bacterium]|nr:hypothetical protein [Thermoanaerobaculia bacterium]